MPHRNASLLGPDPVDVHVGARLRSRRLAMRLSQEQLASEIEVTFQQVQKYERGANRVSASMLWRSARALSCTISYFFEDIGQPLPVENGSSKWSLATLRQLEGLDEGKRRIVTNLVRDLVRPADAVAAE